MRFYRLRAQVEERGNFLRTLPFREKLGYLTLPDGEGGQIRRLISGYRVPLIQETRQHQIVHSGREEHALTLQGFNRRYQITCGVRLKHKTACAGVEGLTNHLIGIGDVQDDDFEVRVIL